MWLAPVLSAGGDAGPLPTTPIQLVGYIIGALILALSPLLIRSRRKDEAVEPPPQLTQSLTQQVVDTGAERLERVMQAHIDAQASQIRRLEQEVREQDDTIEEFRSERERLRAQVGRLKNELSRFQGDNP